MEKIKLAQAIYFEKDRRKTKAVTIPEPMCSIAVLILL